MPHRSGEACRHHELYESDFGLARSLGHNAHRFSIEWSDTRVLTAVRPAGPPAPGAIEGWFVDDTGYLNL